MDTQTFRIIEDQIKIDVNGNFNFQSFLDCFNNNLKMNYLPEEFLILDRPIFSDSKIQDLYTVSDG